MVKLTEEIDELCVYVVGYGMVSLLSPRPADCGKPVEDGFREKAGYTRRATTRAEDTEERVLAMRYGMVFLTTSSRDKLWRAMLSGSLSTSRLRRLATW